MVFRGGNDRGRIEKTYYRSFQAVFNIGARFLVWRRPIPFSGVGSIRKIPELLKKEKVNKVMVVTGPTVGKKLAPKILAELEKSCEGSIAIGGGSPMDAAKAAAARVVRPSTPVGKMAGLLKVGKKIPPYIAVPTTAGTGSETTIAAEIRQRGIRRREFERFITTLKTLPDEVTDFSEDLWGSLVEYLTVYAKDGLRSMLPCEVEIEA